MKRKTITYTHFTHVDYAGHDGGFVFMVGAGPGNEPKRVGFFMKPDNLRDFAKGVLKALDDWEKAAAQPAQTEAP